VHTCLSTPITKATFDALTGKDSVLAKHAIFSGLDNSKFLKLAIAHLIKSPLPNEKLIELLPSCKNMDEFELFILSLKKAGGKKN
jgi:hypothetical protein